VTRRLGAKPIVTKEASHLCTPSFLLLEHDTIEDTTCSHSHSHSVSKNVTPKELSIENANSRIMSYSKAKLYEGRKCPDVELVLEVALESETETFLV
jgi:hypothetical protein